MLRANAQRHLRSGAGRAGVNGNAHGVARRKPHDGAPRRDRLDLGVDEIHARRADKAGHENVVRIPVDVHRRADLLDAPRRQNDDTFRQRHCLHLIVGDVDHRRLELLMELRQLVAHAGAQRRIEIGQRLVEEEHIRLADDGATDGDALPLAAGQRLRLPLQQVLDVQPARGRLNRRIDVRRVQLGEPQPEGHVLVDRHVRVKRIRLEDHGDAPARRGDIVDDLSTDGDFAA